MENKESKKFAAGVVLGTLIGAAALHFFRTAHKPSVIQQVGKTISDFGQVLEQCDFNPADLPQQIAKAMPSKKSISHSFFDLVDFGMNFWKNIK